MEIICEFSIHIGYRCTILSQQIYENTELKFIGNHRVGKSNDDVTEINFKDCTVSKVPQGLTKSFPNLKPLTVTGTKMKKLTKPDLAEYKNFSFFDFSNNKIDFLPDDLFEDFQNLEYISFYGNKLAIVEPNLIDELDKLETIDLRGDTKYGYMNSNVAAPNWDPELNQIKIELRRKFCQNSSSVVAEYLLKQRLNIKSLKNENEYLTNTIQKFQESHQGTQSLVDELVNENQSLKIDVKMSSQKLQILQSSNTKLSQRIQLLSHELKQQKSRNKFTNKIKNFLIQDDIFKDFSIQIDNRDFPVHKFLLAARSPTLAELLKNNPEVENLNLVDISVETFEIILKFLYTDELPGDDGTNFLHLFAAAGKLKIQELHNYAATTSISLINDENALEILNLSNKYGHDELRQKAFEEIKRNYPKIEFEDAWIYDGAKIAKIVEFFVKMKRMEEDFKMVMKDE
ncbi:hypothetical protein ACKWTF_015229 [Chironomus riparius]